MINGWKKGEMKNRVQSLLCVTIFKYLKFAVECGERLNWWQNDNDNNRQSNYSRIKGKVVYQKFFFLNV